MGKPKAPKPPDLQPIIDAQLRLANNAEQLSREFLGLSKEQFDFFREQSTAEFALAKEQADKLFGLQERAFQSDEALREITGQVGTEQVAALRQSIEFANRDRERFETVFKPLQDQFIAEAQAFDTPEKRAQAAAEASVDVQRAAEAQRSNAEAQLQSLGVDPSQFRSSSLLNQVAIGTAAQQAGAANAARRQVEDQGRALRADAINLGSGLPLQSQQGFQTATQQGQGAVGAAAAGQAGTLGALQGGAALGGQGLGFRQNALSNFANLGNSLGQLGSGFQATAGNGFNSAATTTSQGFQNQLDRFNANQAAGSGFISNVSALAGIGGAAFGFNQGGVVRFTQGGDVGFDTGIQRERPDLVDLGRPEAPNSREFAVEDTFTADEVAKADAEAAKKARIDRISKSILGFADTAAANRDRFLSTPRSQLAAAPQFTNTVGALPKFAQGGRVARQPGIPPQPRPPIDGPVTQPQVTPFPQQPPFSQDRFNSPPLIPGGPTPQQIAPQGAGQFSSPQQQSQLVIPSALGPSPFSLNRFQSDPFIGRGFSAARRFNQGGGVEGVSQDTIPAMLAEGEVVIPADVVRAKGTEFFQKIIDRFHREGA